eukprot:TRINITY_DN6887_c0_g1_i2.p1 TRINITY_DN6887_c0_g1~~TRINITY_DN6887_c0_g1_i2.p1  ORF type:complete len:308 (+),score=31.30 TRINITY_DN6887_c0_g1_i2:50-925(+)
MASQQPQRQLFVGCNWKCSLEDVTAVDHLIGELNKSCTSEFIDNVEVCVFPPYPYLQRVRRQLAGEMTIGAQSVWEASSPLSSTTGTVTGAMLKEAGCKWVLLGHADRRHALGETDDLIGEKVRRCLDAGLSVNLTVGDTGKERQAGLTDEVLVRQLTDAFKGVQIEDWSRIVIAYEPVWAVGAGAQPCEPKEAQRVLRLLRAWVGREHGSDASVRCRVVYTGSVNESNAAEYACLPDNDGFVVGRAGLDALKLRDVCAALVRSKASSQVQFKVKDYACGQGDSDHPAGCA